MSEELINALYIKPYTGMIPYLNPASSLMVSDFEKCPLSKDHWLDLPLEDNCRKGCKKRDPNRVFEAFSFFSDHEAGDVWVEMLSTISSDFIYYQNVSWLILQLHKIMLSEWCTNMHATSTPVDELAIFALSKLYSHHSVVYTKNKMWSTIGTSTPMNEKDVYDQCDLKFILMGKGHFVQLIKKLSLSMPVVNLQPMESVYESGYYKDISPEKQGDDITTHPIQSEGNHTPEKEEPNDFNLDKQYCAVHGCDMTDTSNNEPTIENSTLQEPEIVNFPVVTKVCETASNSSLHEFNPLNDSEPNLEFDMTDQDNKENPSLHVKLM